MRYERIVLIIVALSFLAVAFLACAPATLNIMPDKTTLSPALIKKPVTFTGSGFQPNETVTVELIIPEGMKIKGLEEDEDRVGIAFGTADDKGNFKAAMPPTATLFWFFQAGWDPVKGKPIFKEAKPLPPGKYHIEATGVYSEKQAKGILELVKPLKKK